MRAAVCLVIASGAFASCGDPIDPVTGCPAGTHIENNRCIADVVCLDTTCSTHGACVVGDTRPLCTCDGAYTGDNCETCAEGFQDNAGTGICTPDCSASPCGAHGTCDDSSGIPACICRDGTTGGACDQCPAPTATIISHVFGNPGTHPPVTVQPGAIVVAPLPMAPSGNGTISASQVTQSPNGTLLYRLAFSRCPGDLTAFSKAQVTAGVTPCYSETSNYAAPGLLNWNATAASFSTCMLPPADGPWYVNMTVDYDAAMEACTGMINGCVIDWQWN